MGILARKENRWFVCSLVSLVAMLLLLPVTDGQHVLQRARIATFTNDVTVKNEAQLRKAFKNLQAGQTVTIDAEEIALKQTLIVRVPGVTIQGTMLKSTVIRCPQMPHAASALTIREGQVRIKSLRFIECSDHSAVVLQTKNGRRDDTMRVTFVRVFFARNGQARRHIFGGAVRSDACAADGCAKAALTFHSCRFIENRAELGGAVFAEDADIVIHNSTFVANEADLSGGAIYLRNKREATMTITDSRFESNRAISDSEVHGIDEDQLLRTTNQTLAASGIGGAILVHNIVGISVRSVAFLYNTGCRGGGAIAVCHRDLLPKENTTHAFELIDSLFRRNVGYCGPQLDALKINLRGPHVQQAGALLYHSLDETPIAWKIEKCEFSHNRAQDGGAVTFISVHLSTAMHRIRNCTFHENIALRTGGNLAIDEAHVELMSTVMRGGRAMYGGSIVVVRTAFLTFQPDPDDPNLISHIEGSTAAYGGGILLNSGGGLDLSALSIRNNIAYREGGGIRVTVTPEPIVLRGVTIADNQALAGGGMHFVSSSVLHTTSFRGQSTVFRNNTAAVGGGIHYETGRAAFFTITINNTVFVGNRALPPDDLLVMELEDTGHTYLPLPSEPMNLPDLESHLGKFTLLRFLTEIDPGYGGGVCVSFINAQLFAIAEVRFMNTLFLENEAVVGGGMSMHLTDLYWNKDDRTNCLPAAIGLDACQQFVLHNVTIRRNKATYAGGIFSTVADGIKLSCSPGNETYITGGAFTPTTLEKPGLRPYCSDVYDNEVTEGVNKPGANAGTGAVYLKVEDWDGASLKEVASGENLALPCDQTENASCHRPLRIAVKDMFNQTIVRGIDDAHLDLSLISDNIVGDLRYTAVDGIAVINNTMAWGVGVTSNVTIVSERNRNVRLVLRFSTRMCYPGEMDQVNVCRRCPPGQYGFVPSLRTCRSCEENARCSGGADLSPIDGFWHSTPFSPVIHHCIQSDACKYPARAEKLAAYSDDAPKVNADWKRLNAYLEGKGPLPVFPDYHQCAEGYDGVLCGSCQQGYGHTITSSCQKCPERQTTSGLLIFLGVIWLLLIIGANCGITLMSIDARVQLVKSEEHDSVKKRARHFKRSAQIRKESRSIRPSKKDSSGSPHSSQSVDLQTQEILTEQLVVTVQLTETLKILMNFLQVTCSALHLNANWSGLVTRLLTIESGLTGLSNEFLDVPLECRFDTSGTPASVSAVWLRLARPWIVLCALLVLFSLYWLISCIRTKADVHPKMTKCRTGRRFVTCLIVISIVTTYFSYINVVRELSRSINCIDMGEAGSSFSGDHPYTDYNIEKDRRKVWVEDTDVTCFEGSHLPLGIVGLIGLILAFLGIVFIVVWLPLNRKRVTKAEFVARYWFLYQAYRKEWHTNAWESTILIRKALIAAVLVFSVHLTPVLQASLCIGVLATALAIHSLFQPFRTPEKPAYVPEYSGNIFRVLHVTKLAPRWIAFNNSVHLNTLESASLFSSIAVFLYAIVLYDDKCSAIGRVCMTVFTFSVNVMFLVYMFYRLYAGMHVLLDLKLEMANATFMATHENNTSLLNFAKKCLTLLRAMMSSQTEENKNSVVQGEGEGEAAAGT